jgi:ABC-type transporter Mla subunit MlaD
LPNNTIDLAHTEVPYDLQQALTDATGTYEQMDFTNFGQSLGALGTQLKSPAPLVPQAMENLRRLADIIGTRRDQIGSLLKTTETVTNTLHSQQATSEAWCGKAIRWWASSSNDARPSMPCWRP